jgi:hypothetical protein
MIINSLAVKGEGCHKKLVGAIVLMQESKKHRGIFRRTENYRIFAPILDVISLHAEIDTILYRALCSGVLVITIHEYA